MRSPSARRGCTVAFGDGSMTIAVSIAVGVALTGFMYWLLFGDVGDFIGGALAPFHRRLLDPEDLEDRCPAGWRFAFLLVVCVGGACLVFHFLEKHFG